MLFIFSDTGCLFFMLSKHIEMLIEFLFKLNECNK